jgi:hypothetical protein
MDGIFMLVHYLRKPLKGRENLFQASSTSLVCTLGYGPIRIEKPVR